MYTADFSFKWMGRGMKSDFDAEFTSNSVKIHHANIPLGHGSSQLNLFHRRVLCWCTFEHGLYVAFILPCNIYVGFFVVLFFLTLSRQWIEKRGAQFFILFFPLRSTHGFALNKTKKKKLPQIALREHRLTENLHQKPTIRVVKPRVPKMPPESFTV